jgi:GTP cyclohydrolase IV
VDVPVAGPALSRVGLAAVDAVVLLVTDGGSPRPLPARLECVVEPDPARAAPEPVRSEEVVADALRHAVAEGAATRPERLAQAIAERAREREAARRAEVTVTARFPEQRCAPVSGIRAQQLSTLYGRAVATERDTRRMVGVAAHGTTTSPHGPIGVGTLHLGCSRACGLEVDAVVLLAIVRRAMSGEVPEDCVSAMIAEVVARFADAPGDVFVSAVQQSAGAIHGHRVTAGREGLLGDLRRELRTGTAVAPGPSLRGWLGA